MFPTSPEALELSHSHSHCVSEQVSFWRNVAVASFVEVCGVEDDTRFCDFRRSLWVFFFVIL